MSHLIGIDLNSKFELEPGKKDVKKLNTFLLSKKIKPLCRLSDRIAYQLLASEGKSIFDVNHKPIYNLKNEWVPLLHFLKVK